MAWAPDYVTTAEARAYITRVSDTVDDAEIALAITAASRAVDRHTNRQFGVVAAAEERFYLPRYDRNRCRWVLDVDDFATTDDLELDVDGTTVTTVTAEPRNAPQKGRPWTRLVFTDDSEATPSDGTEVAVTAVWGWTTVPTPIEQATLLQTSRLFTRRNAPFGIAGSPESGSEMRLLARVDPDVAVTLGPFVRWWAAA